MKLFKALFCAATATVLAVSASAATTLLPGVLKQEVYAGATRAQVLAGTATATPTVSTLSQWDRGDIGDNYSARMSGVVIPATTGLYDFYLAADDDTDLFLSTDSTAANKVQIAAEPSYAGVRAWTGNTQRGSATWTNAAGATPFAAGISLTAGTRYYLEAVQHEGGGGDNFAVTMVPHGTVLTDGDATTLTGSLIGVLINTPTNLTFTANPTNATAYVGTSARFRVATSTDSEFPAVYQWRRNGVDIPGATGQNYQIVASSSDNGATFDCVARVPNIAQAVLTRTSLVATVTVPASGALTVNGYLKREVIAGYTTANVRTNIANGAGGLGTITAVNQFDVGSAGANYAERVNGYFTPSVSGSYVVALAADDDTDLYLSTDAQPNNKRLVARETVWSNNREWITSSSTSDNSLKSSYLFTPDGINFPYLNGIDLVAGQRYYIEAIHRAGGGGNGVSATFVLKSDYELGVLTNGAPSKFTNGVISYVTRPVTSFTVAPLINQTVFEALPYKFQVVVTTDSEVSPNYQWKRGGVPIPGATASSYSGTAALADNGATFSVDVTIPGVTNTTSTTATLTVNASAFAEGSLKVERWNGTVLTRAIIGANAAGTVPEPDSIRYITSGFDFTDSGSDYVLRVSGFFVPATTGNYVFYVAADDDTDVYIGTNDKADTKRLIAQEGGWSGNKNWNTVGGGGTISQRRSDQWSPDAGATVPYSGGIALTAGTRYYIEAVNHQGGGGQNLAVTYTLLGEASPANGTATKLIGARVGVLVPAATVLNITQDVASVSALVTEPVNFTVGATNNGLLPTSYQWRRGGTAIAGATGRGYNFIASTSDNGAQFSCVMSVPGTSLSVTSSVGTLTIATGGTLVSGQLGRERWNGNFNRAGIEAGNGGPASISDTVTNIDIGELGDNYVQRIRGYFIPAATGKYAFFVNSDDDSDLFLSTDTEPSNKRLIAQQGAWSNPRRWNTQGDGTGTQDPAVVSQKRSDQWVPDPANPPGGGAPYAAGIQLTAGQRYYIEVVHAEGGGGDNLGVTFMFHATDIFQAIPPTDNDPSAITASMIGYLSTPGLGKTISITKSGASSVNVSWTPAGGRLLSTPALGAGAVWTDLGSANPQTITVQPGNLFLEVVTP